ncbi:hypothetical protein L3X38_026332 [Prunus dulcis]|uniref:Uncharacterized protein n=1 Tax=Prunus dulcis TaxID=3755 RepID=A0AAD4VLS1_PRUDU|nr:hypothetical protein L3X38_026332 [Prunus dulcis]
MSPSPSCSLKFLGVLPMFLSTLINGVKLILVLCAVSLLATLLLIRVISAIIHLPRRGERGSELESLELENLIFELENDVFGDTVLKKETTGRIEASDWSPISEDKTCGLCEETTGCPLELDRSPISRDEACALGVETTGGTEASDRSLVYDNSDSDSCMDELDAIPPLCPASAPIYL